MILYPAIDLKDGNCVRLLHGEMDQATIFSNTPADQAKAFAQEGFEWLHVVDLNGAFAGKPVNKHAVETILSATSVPVQLGGGIRDMATIALWINAGISRVILGTAALRNPELVHDACKEFEGRIAVGIDARNGMVAVEGWAETSDISAKDLAHKFEDAGVAAIIYTDIGRDGAMQGPNFAETVALAESITIPVILSGGMTSLDDVKTLCTHAKSGIQGAILGRALYDGAIQPRAALAAIQESKPC
ncbi:MAG: 1-(5-phosphoribosyl)-5-[(5-phosphoribosylamino)methylideneamino]imidazole-4-carboxamide isomerase [Alphaproteobacteria bacterium]|nr:1-(5-phosphoribosyl)-5-[(5-phosphoribosylamino)methylideneamino]imidazole-4-carboxamide isomerase [Alphaproteobacteria bacterium]